MIEFLKRQSILPFETCFGFICIYGGIAAITNFGIVDNPFRNIFGYKISMFFNITYLIAGIMLYFGVGFAKRNIETFGLILLATSILIRTIAIASKLGMSPMLLNAYILNTAFVLACIVRCYGLFSGKIIVETQEIEIPKHKHNDKRILSHNRDN